MVVCAAMVAPRTADSPVTFVAAGGWSSPGAGVVGGVGVAAVVVVVVVVVGATVSVKSWVAAGVAPLVAVIVIG